MERLVLGSGEFSMTKEEFTEWQVKNYNESEGHLHEQDGIECEKCLNKGDIQYVKDGYVYSQRCECHEKRLNILRAKKSGLGEYLNKRLSDYEVAEEWQGGCKRKAIEYIKSDGNEWFVALGTVGSGKTLLCSIVANNLLFKKGRNVLYVTWTDFISRLKRDMMSDNANEVSTYLDEIKKVDVLFFDELIKKYNDTDLKYLIEIINYRYTNDLKTIITSEKTLNELLDVDEAIFSRVAEKCGGFLINIPKDRHKNYRLKGLI